MNILEFHDVKKDYHLGETTVHALRGVNLAIESGEFIAILGTSGSGKTTLLNLAGVIDDPTEGEIFINGKSSSRLTDNEKAELRNKMIGYVFQTFNLVSVLSALENVMLPLQIRGGQSSVIRAEARRRLEDVGLGDFLQHRPDKLSGGQRQRVAIARALITKPLLIFADEPTANLDHQTASSIIDLMKDLNDRDKVTFVFSTHDQRLIDRVGRVVRIDDGKIVQ
jgi:putative ABC transport system ATP-binding protein